jgi:hypothetical protein
VWSAMVIYWTQTYIPNGIFFKLPIPSANSCHYSKTYLYVGGRGVTFYKITEEPESDKQYWSDKIRFVYTGEPRNLIRR